MKKIITTLIIISCFWFFFYANKLNYNTHLNIMAEKITHPEFIPSKEFAKQTSFWFKNIKADLYWLETIQYIWSNAASSKYKKYLFSMIDLVTELNPNFENPYRIGQLLMPSFNPRYEKITEDQNQIYVDQAIKLSEKWIDNFCNKDLIKEVLAEEDLKELWENEKYHDTCRSFNIPYYLGYTYNEYKNDIENTYKYYKISSVHKDALQWSKTLTAIMRWKSWDRIKSVITFLTLAESLPEDIPWCHAISDTIMDITRNNIVLNNSNVKLLNEETKKILPFDSEGWSAWASECSVYVNKAVREFNLAFLDWANNALMKDWFEPAKSSKELLEKWYIWYEPTDFQQYENYGVEYIYNEEMWRFDYDLVYPE